MGYINMLFDLLIQSLLPSHEMFNWTESRYTLASEMPGFVTRNREKDLEAFRMAANMDTVTYGSKEDGGKELFDSQQYL